MELRTHAHILKNARWFIVLFTILVGVAALLFSLFRPVPYKALVSFDVAFVNRPETPDYQYGAYYDLKAGEIYTQHLMSWFMTPAIVADIYEAAGIPYKIDNIARFTNRFQAKQYSAQNFVVIFKEYNRETAGKLAQGVIEVVETRVQDTSTAGDQIVFAVTGLDPVIAKAEYSPWLVTGVGALVGLIISLLLVYLREYFRA